MSREREVVLVLWESPANPAEALARGGEREDVNFRRWHKVDKNSPALGGNGICCTVRKMKLSDMSGILEV